MNYLFHLGRDAELSALEVVSYLERTKRTYQVKKVTKLIMMVSIDAFDPVEAMKCLGGTIKISAAAEDADAIIRASMTKNRISVGMTVLESGITMPEQVVQQIKTIAREEHVKVMQKHKTGRDIPPSKSKGLDLEMVIYKNILYHVVAVSDPKSYAQRDEKRPFFDPLMVISVRLAKILINLSQVKPNGVLLDPFCGLGTILQEAALMQLQPIGSDDDSRNIRECKENLAWAKKTVGMNILPKVTIRRVEKMGLVKADAIATEPYLGPFLKKLPFENEARDIAAELTPMYDSFLREARKTLRVGAKMAVIVPSFKTRNEKVIRIGFQTLLKNHNFAIVQPLKNTLIPLEYTLKGSKIRRQIYVVEKLK